MKTRDAVLENAHTLANAETNITDIDLTDPISALTIQVTGKNGATSNKANFIHDVVTKIEIVDGSDTLISLTMPELLALHFYNTRGKPPILRPSEWSGGDQVEGGTIFFGRYLYDKIYAFDPTKFSNPQLKITVNIEAVRDIAVTAFATGTLKLTVIAKVMEELEPRPIGFITSKQIKSWVTVEAGDEPTDIPTDYPIKAILFRSYESEVDIDEALTKLKISINEGKFIPLEIDGKDLWEENFQKFGELVYRHDFFTKNNQTIKLLVNHDPVCAFKSDSEGRIFWCSWEWSSATDIRVETDAGVAVAADENVRGLIRGSAPLAALIYEFGNETDPTEWLTLAPTDNAKILATQGNAGGAASIVLQQLRPYA